MGSTKEQILILKALKLLLKIEYWGRGTRETIKEYDEIKKEIEEVLKD